MNIIRDIQLISALDTNKAELLKQLESGDPIILTENGAPKVVIQDAAAYQELLDAQEELIVIRGVARGIADVEAGRTKDTATFFSELRKKHGLPG